MVKTNLVWDLIPIQLAKENKKFFFDQIKKEGEVPSLKAFFEKYHPQTSIRFSALPYRDQGWMKNIPLYAVCTVGKIVNDE